VADGRWCGWQPGAKASIMRMRPPQHGHGCAVVDGSVGPLSLSVRTCGFDTASSSRSCKVFCAERLGQQSVVTNAMEALWQDVANKETANKFICCERHDLVARLTVGTIIFVV